MDLLSALARRTSRLRLVVLIGASASSHLSKSLDFSFGFEVGLASWGGIDDAQKFSSISVKSESAGVGIATEVVAQEPLQSEDKVYEDDVLVDEKLV